MSKIPSVKAGKENIHTVSTAICWHCSQLLELSQFLMCWQTEYFSQSMGGGIVFLNLFGGGGREGYGAHILPKKPKMAPITDHLPADLSPDASADTPPRINIG